MNEIDWIKAPEGATHFGAENEDYHACWYIVEADRIAVMYAHKVNDKWTWRSIDDEDRLTLIPRLTPRPAAWNGEGLPPVGTVCEYDAAAQGQPPYWHTVEVVYASEWVIVVRCLQNPDEATDVVGVENAVDATEEAKSLFRPIRTPEQIAAEERERACDVIYGILRKAERPGNLSDMAEAIYDAGYRKIEGGEA